MINERYIYGVKHIDGRYEHAEGATAQEAIAALGWHESDVRRTIPVKALHIVRPMPEDVKKLLKEKQALRRAVRAPKRRREK